MGSNNQQHDEPLFLEGEQGSGKTALRDSLLRAFREGGAMAVFEVGDRVEPGSTVEEELLSE